MAELRIKRGSLLIQILDRFRGETDCVFATLLRPTPESTDIEHITLVGWTPAGEPQELETGVWRVAVKPVPLGEKN